MLQRVLRGSGRTLRAASAAPSGPWRLSSSAAASLGVVRSDWTVDEIAAVYNLPFTELLHRASTVHRQNFDPLEVQRCTLLSIKTGGCTEDCKYCAQSTRYKTFVKPEPMMKHDVVIDAARRAKENGSTRFCMGTAWREMGNKKGAFGKILKMVSEVNGMGLEVCCTLGMLSETQARAMPRPQGSPPLLCPCARSPTRPRQWGMRLAG